MTRESFTRWVRRLLCGHNSTEMWRESETLPNGVTTTYTAALVCMDCGKDLIGDES